MPGRGAGAGASRSPPAVIDRSTLVIEHRSRLLSFLNIGRLSRRPNDFIDQPSGGKLRPTSHTRIVAYRTPGADVPWWSSTGGFRRRRYTPTRWRCGGLVRGTTDSRDPRRWNLPRPRRDQRAADDPRLPRRPEDRDGRPDVSRARALLSSYGYVDRERRRLGDGRLQPLVLQMRRSPTSSAPARRARNKAWTRSACAVRSSRSVPKN